MYSLGEVLVWCLVAAVVSPVACCIACGFWRLCRERLEDWLFRMGGRF
jgi:hypothetical protein